MDKDFKFLEIGNTYSEYECLHCGASVVIQMEDMDDAVLDRHRRDCSANDTEVKG